MELYKKCMLCPRNCGVNRLAGETGFCGETSVLRAAFAGIHKGEEPPLTGTGGSGTIFISGCNLRCTFCQNRQISQGAENEQRINKEISNTLKNSLPALGSGLCPQEFVKICAALKEKGAENINIVTGSHAIPAIAEGIAAAKEAGIDLPVVWNSSGYEKPKAISLLKNNVDIYLPDLKTLDSELASKFFNAPDYPEAAVQSILKMIEVSIEPQNKVIIRHLILPGYLESTRSVLKWFSANAKNKARLSLLTQYTPIPGSKREMPDRFLNKEEYNTVINWLNEFEIEDGYCQELVTGNEWLPDFNLANPFSSELSIPVWHC